MWGEGAAFPFYLDTYGNRQGHFNRELYTVRLLLIPEGPFNRWLTICRPSVKWARARPGPTWNYIQYAYCLSQTAHLIDGQQFVDHLLNGPGPARPHMELYTVRLLLIPEGPFNRWLTICRPSGITINTYEKRIIEIRIFGISFKFDILLHKWTPYLNHPNRHYL